jgi:hypothetical protein
MAGADVAVTDERIANLVMEYAMYLGRVGTTDTVTMPVARHGRSDEASLLIGPASQIALTTNDDASLETVELPHVDEVLDDLRGRIRAVPGGRGTREVVPEDDDEGAAAFVDFGDF